MADTVDVLLRKTDEAVEQARAHYETDLAAKELSDELLYAVRQVVQDCQSALDMTATAVKKKHGEGDWRPYFPLAKDADSFPAEMEKQIKGLATSKPNIAAAFERHQPYQRGKTELGDLRALRRVNTHEAFTPQTRTERQVGLRQQYAGAMVETDDRGNVRAGPVVGSTNTVLDGSPPLRTERLIYVDWQFVDPPVSVRPTLEALARLTRAAVEDIRREAQL